MSKPIRILHVLGRLDRGGAETMVMNLYRNIDRSIIQFDFVIHTEEECDFNKEIYTLGGKVFSIPRYTGKNHYQYKKSWNKLFRDHPEYKIIHGHMRSTASLYLRIAKRNGLVTIAHSHSIASRGSKIHRLIKSIMQFPIRFIADYLFACSDEAGKWLFGNNVQRKNNFHIIRNAIDVNEFRYDIGTRKRVRKKYNLENKFVLGHVGNFTKAKNHLFLLEIFAEVQKLKENTVLILLGNGELKREIHNKAQSLGVRNKVMMFGTKDNVNDFLQAMDVFVFPSLFEGLGLAVIEAQATGLPCVISDTIPDEVIVSDLVHKYPIAIPTYWADSILNINYKDRKSALQCIKKHGYDVSMEARELNAIYQTML